MNQALMTRYAADYSDGRFWQKLMSFARNAGREVVQKSLWLYFAAQRPDTPKWAKATVYGALGYFILPADALPDVTPFAGFSDDLAVLAFAVVTLGAYINDAVKEQAAQTMARWFPG